MFTEYKESSTEVNYYEAAFKTNLVDEVIHENRTGAQIASAHHIKRGTVNKWVSRLGSELNIGYTLKVEDPDVWTLKAPI